jgi:hypothetical protein
MTESWPPCHVQQYNLRPRVAVTAKLSGAGHSKWIRAATLPGVRLSAWLGAIDKPRVDVSPDKP